MESAMFKRILVAVDGSSTANQALQEAIKLAREMQGQLRIVHVIDTVNLNLDTEFPATPAIWDVTTKSAEEILRKAETVASNAGIGVESHLIKIDTLGKRIPEMIVKDAEDWSADVIVICTHGRSGLSHLFLGSVAEGIMRVATKPVLLIRGK
jgi:nucleotide-binding universal stress UspA family protein